MSSITRRSDGLYFDLYDRYGGTPPNIGACLSLASMYRSWFHFSDNNVPCTTNDYPGWDGFSSLPTFDHTNPAVQNFFYKGAGNVTQYWYSQGANGWRFDVADDPNFPHAWWNDYRTYAKNYNPNGPLIGEIWPNASQWLAGDQMDSVMSYRFRKNITPASCATPKSIQPHGPVTLGTGGSYSFSIQLQASRNGNDLDGRQYTITVSGSDYAGNLGSSSTIVTVPHDQGN